MSSYYSQSLQYKPHEQHYLQQTINHTAINSNNISHNHSTRNSTRNNDNNGINSSNQTEDNNEVRYAPSVSKKMTTTTYYVQKSSGGIVGSNSPINTYGTATSAATSDYNKLNYATRTNDLQMTSTKINSHLLDHGYGATPQPSYSNSSNNSDDSGLKSYTRTTDGGITSYYKVSKPFQLIFFFF